MADEGQVEVEIEERPAGRVAWLRLANPRKLNALSPALTDALAARAAELAADAALRAVVIAGAGERAFSAGADLEHLEGLDEAGARAFITGLHRANDAVRRLPVPSVAMLRGPCLGGGMELAASCDIRIGDTTTTVGMPEVRLGMPSVIEAVLLPGILGWGAAAEILLTGETVDAAEAHRIGFLQRLVEPHALEAETRRLLDALLANGPGALRAQKRLFHLWRSRGEAEAIAASIEDFAAAFRTGEAPAMIAAFRAARRREKSR